MASNLMVEDTDEDFFDKLVNDDDDDDYKPSTTLSSKEESNIVDDNDSDDAKAFANLSISDVGIGLENLGKVGIVDEDFKDSSSINNDIKHESANTSHVEPSHMLVSSNSFAFDSVNQEPDNETIRLEEPLDSTTVSENHGSGGTAGVKEVQWSAFASDSVEISHNTFESYPDFFNEFRDGSVDQVVKEDNFISSQTNSVVNNPLQVKNVDDYSQQFQTDQVYATTGEQGTHDQDPNSSQPLSKPLEQCEMMNVPNVYGNQNQLNFYQQCVFTLVEEPIIEETPEFDSPPIFDEAPEEDDVIYGDTEELLVIRRALAVDLLDDAAWLRNNILHTRCTSHRKVCNVIIDSGSCEIVVSETMVKKLLLKTEKHPYPYKLSWLQKGKSVQVDQQCLVKFSIGDKYRDDVWCDVVPMDACRVLLGRPMQFDRRTIHDGLKNTYSFEKNRIKIVLGPSRYQNTASSIRGEGKFFLSKSKFNEAMTESKVAFALVIKKVVDEHPKVPEILVPLLENFQSIIPNEIPPDPGESESNSRTSFFEPGEPDTGAKPIKPEPEPEPEPEPDTGAEPINQETEVLSDFLHLAQLQRINWNDLEVQKLRVIYGWKALKV